MYTVGSCFSGIGGFEFGLEMAGFKTSWQIEYDDFCQKVLEKHWPDVKKYRDINDVKIETLEEVGLLSGGYPCQPFSFAGKRQGDKDDRHLWPKMLEIIEAKRPNWVICENVYGHVNMGLDQVLTDLENASYAWQTFIVPAVAVDAPHRRDRIWVIANTSDPRCKPTTKERTRRKKDTRTCEIRSRVERLCSSMADTDSKRRKSCGKNFPQLEKFKNNQYSRWQPEPPICRVVNGVSTRLDKDRLKALGNAIVPQIAYQIGMAIIATEQEYKKENL